MDTVSFRTLGGGAAHDTGLGARTPERDGHYDLAGGYGAWGSHLGFGSYGSRSKLHFALGGGSVPRNSGSGAPAFDQCCRIKRSRPDSTHRRIGRRLNGLEKNDEQHTSRKWTNGRSACFHCTCLRFCHGPLPRLAEADTNPGALKYHSKFDVRLLVAQARAELTEADKVELFKIFVLAAMSGLRRREIDLLPWSAFRWNEGILRIEATELFQPKSDESTGDLPLDPELVSLFRGYYARAKSEFVIESDLAPNVRASYLHYRCGPLFRLLSGWLRDHGV